MNLKYIKMNPSGNTTILVEDAFSRDLYGSAAARIMMPEFLCAEQVGYIEQMDHDTRMEMMGGEFCGNASRCFAVWKYLYEPERGRGVDGGPSGSLEFFVETSGADCPSKVTVCRKTETVFDASIVLAPPLRIIQEWTKCFGMVTIVAFAGITHFVLLNRRPEKNDEQEARRLIARYGLPDEAYGLMYYDEPAGFLRPFIAVRDSGSRVWESSCGSGSCALASALAARDSFRQERYDFSFRQPGGILNVAASVCNGQVSKLVLGGPVEITSFGTVCI